MITTLYMNYHVTFLLLETYVEVIETCGECGEGCSRSKGERSLSCVKGIFHHDQSRGSYSGQWMRPRKISRVKELQDGKYYARIVIRTEMFFAFKIYSVNYTGRGVYCLGCTHHPKRRRYKGSIFRDYCC